MNKPVNKPISNSTHPGQNGKTRHIQIEQQLAIYADLTPSERAQVDTHLLACPSCAAIWQRDQELSQALSDVVEQRRQQLALQPAANPRRADARFQAALRRPAWTNFSQPGNVRIVPRLRWLPVTIALIVLLALSLGLGQAGSGITLLTNVYATSPTPTPPVKATAIPSHLYVTTTPQSHTSTGLEAEARAGIEAALALEQQAHLQKHASKEITLELVDLVIEGDFVRAQILTKRSDGTTQQGVEERLYRRVGERWLLTSPTPDAAETINDPLRVETLATVQAGQK